ncbi:Gfo/Idh/MocA family protein [Paenibacillus allorhizosphaerae]|uniref:Oxidoreductase YteT n=1 Tax=Paenibacillus allorhizosphaerae TaxID=2849866 RepID=A0ABM8VB72_9BACL|nr:Gfo/Idh/MocA family oxidoreductase [Paenibacillus allorhizosphaerae]CAG7618585.1 Putative oxidoreductase YteT [Paenibacillus allorhizosphaerae]
METNRSSNNPITAIIVGAGHRAVLYASYANSHPEELQIVGVVDPDPIRRKQCAEKFHIGADAVFESIEQLTSRGKIADAVINGTMDAQHVETSLPLLRAGYDILLEKPIGTSAEEIMELHDCARAHGRKVMICHVLRYAPFYVEIHKRLAAGEIGDIQNMQTTELVSYHHMAMAFVRGKWGSKEKCKSSMLMAKCCHDLDLLTWMMRGVVPEKVSSMGGLTYFRPERAPEGAGTRCLLDCPIEASCVYSAKKHYVEQGLWKSYVSPHYHLGVRWTEEQLIESLRTDNPYGRCVWKCDNDVVDHQSVVVQFADGSTATHNMVGGASKPGRRIHIIGTEGEIEGFMEDGYFIVRHPDARRGHEYTEERVELNVSKDMHGGGDLRLVADFVRVLRGETPSISSTALEQSIYGHLIGFAADRAMESNRVMDIPRL